MIKMSKEEEKVINGLYSCYYRLCESCPYNENDDCGHNLIYDAYILLKNQYLTMNDNFKSYIQD